MRHQTFAKLSNGNHYFGEIYNDKPHGEGLNIDEDYFFECTWEYGYITSVKCCDELYNKIQEKNYISDEVSIAQEIYKDIMKNWSGTKSVSEVIAPLVQPEEKAYEVKRLYHSVTVSSITQSVLHPVQALRCVMNVL